MTITLAWWAVPTLITLLGFVWAVFWVEDDSGYLSGIGNMLALIPVCVVSMLAWIVAAVLK